MANNVTLKLLTYLVHDGNGHYRTYPRGIFENKFYEEGEIEEYVSPEASGYPAPGGVIVPVTCSWDVFEVIDNAQSGADAEGETPDFALIEGSVYDADTGEPVDPTSI
jgi:hypothetical protein